MTPTESPAEASYPQYPASPRRDDVERKQLLLARLLSDSGCEGILLRNPANFRWITGGAEPHPIHEDETPALFANANQRWLLCNSADTQRYFDEELDGLGFQVKEWPCHGSREQHLADLCLGRKVACDIPFRDCKFVGLFLDAERRRLSAYEQACAMELGKLLAHALEATARNLTPGDTEEEIAGHLGHRLLKRGLLPADLQVVVDQRMRGVHRPRFTAARLERACTVQASATKLGLFATASRTVFFGEPDPEVREEHELASRLSVYGLSALKDGSKPAAGFEAARALLKPTPHEHAWRDAPLAWYTGRLPSEGLLTPASGERLALGHAVVWRSCVGSGIACDTYVLTETGWRTVTSVEEWPTRRYVIKETRIERPDALIR